MPDFGFVKRDSAKKATERAEREVVEKILTEMARNSALREKAAKERMGEERAAALRATWYREHPFIPHITEVLTQFHDAEREPWDVGKVEESVSRYGEHGIPFYRWSVTSRSTSGQPLITVDFHPKIKELRVEMMRSWDTSGENNQRLWSALRELCGESRPDGFANLSVKFVPTWPQTFKRPKLGPGA